MKSFMDEEKPINSFGAEMGSSYLQNPYLSNPYFSGAPMIPIPSAFHKTENQNQSEMINQKPDQRNELFTKFMDKLNTMARKAEN